jgi:hypothetical protein
MFSKYFRPSLTPQAQRSSTHIELRMGIMLRGLFLRWCFFQLLPFFPFTTNISAATTITTIAKPATTPKITSSKLDLEVVLGFGVPTTMGVPVKADAGIVADTMSGGVNAVESETQAPRSSIP